MTARSPRKHKTAAQRSFESRVWHRLFVDTGGVFCSLDLETKKCVLAAAIKQEYALMAYWSPSYEAHGLPTQGFNRFLTPHSAVPDSNLAATPPMSLPLVDANNFTPDLYNTNTSQQHQHPNNNWNNHGAAPPCSPFRQHNMPSSLPPGAMSPHELHPRLNHALMTPSYDVDDSFIINDAAVPFAIPGPVRRRGIKQEPLGLDGDMFPQGSGGSGGMMMSYMSPVYDMPQQQQQHYGQMTPTPPVFPSLPRQKAHRRALPNAAPVPNNDPTTTIAKQEPRQRRLEDFQHTFTLHKRTPKPPKPPARAPKVIHSTPRRVLRLRAGPKNNTNSTFVAPSANMPGFVPISHRGTASAAQGNCWPIPRELLEQIVAAERAAGEQKLTYKEIKAKYDAWQISESTLRGIKRVFELPREHRERIPTWKAEHIKALERAVPRCMERKKILWGQVVEYIKRQTGKPFGAGTCRKKWESLHPTDKGTTATRRKKSLTLEDDEEEIEADENDEDEEVASYCKKSDTSSEDSDVLSERVGGIGFVNIPGNVPVAWPAH